MASVRTTSDTLALSYPPPPPPTRNKRRVADLDSPSSQLNSHLIISTMQTRYVERELWQGRIIADLVLLFIPAFALSRLLSLSLRPPDTRCFVNTDSTRKAESSDTSVESETLDLTSRWSLSRVLTPRRLPDLTSERWVSLTWVPGHGEQATSRKVVELEAFFVAGIMGSDGDIEAESAGNGVCGTMRITRRTDGDILDIEWSSAIHLGWLLS